MSGTDIQQIPADHEYPETGVFVRKPWFPRTQGYLAISISHNLNIVSPDGRAC